MDKITNPLVSIGIVTWNSADVIPDCLESLSKQTYKPLELIVVDNNSQDSSRDIINNRTSGDTHFFNQSNLGYCKAHNQAISAAQGKYYLPLNPDVKMEPAYIEHLVEVMELDQNIGSAGGKLLYPTDQQGKSSIDSTGLFIDRRRRQYLRGNGEEDLGQYDCEDEVFGVDGAAPLYRRAMLEDICIEGQYFDESFFAHKEDVDLAWRARWLGWRCFYTPKAIAFHKRSFRPGIRTPISPDIKVHAIANRYLLLIKNECGQGFRRDGLRIAWYDLKIIAYLCLFERHSLCAINKVRQFRKQAIGWRKVIKERRRIPPKQMLEWFR